MDHPNRHVVTLAVLAGVVIGALLFKAIISRGKSLVEGFVGIVSGIAGAAIFGGIAHLGSGPPDWVTFLISTPDAWTASCAAFGAMFGDRIAVGAMVEADRFKQDPQAWAARWFPWMRRGGGDAR